jgi:hypothetical protein
MLGFLFVLVALVQGQEVDPTTGLTATQQTNILNEHNQARRTLANPTAANMIELRWDPLLAQTAFNYLTTAGCSPFDHNPNRETDYHALGGTNDNGGGVGENWYSGNPDASTDTAINTGPFMFGGGAVAAWTVDNCLGISGNTCTDPVCSESDNFYGRTRADGGAQCSNTGLFAVGHFTQVMWATTAWVGCGHTAACGTLCDYAPAGNSGFTQADVWIAGTPGSQCPTGFTGVDGLCSAAGVITTTPPPGATTSTPETTATSTPQPTSTAGPTTTAPTTSPAPTTTRRGNLPPPPPGRVIFPKPATPKPTPKATPKATVKQGANKKKKPKRAAKKKNKGVKLPTKTARPIFPH